MSLLRLLPPRAIRSAILWLPLLALACRQEVGTRADANPELETAEVATHEVATHEVATPAETGELDPSVETSAPSEPSLKKATFGSGCFWCTEAVFQRLRGVEAVVSGYSGGSRPDPSYEEVCTGLSGHAEVVQVTYDPAQVSYATLLEAFWKSHDPTTPNQQGNDFGPQYRSVVFYHDEEQAALARRYRDELDRSGAFPAPIVTEISRFEAFYPAEAEHQDFFERFPSRPYCFYVIAPKLAKFEEVFGDRLKSNATGEGEGGR